MDPVELMNSYTNDRRPGESMVDFITRSLAKACDDLTQLREEVRHLQDCLKQRAKTNDRQKATIRNARDCQNTAKARVVVLEEEKARLLTDWLKLCAAIVRMPQDVECHHHRKGNYVIDTDRTHREPLIRLYLKQRGERATIDAGKDDRPEREQFP